MRKYKVALTFSEIGGKGNISDQEGYIEQYRDEWTFDSYEESSSFMLAIQKATELVRLLWRQK